MLQLHPRGWLVLRGPLGCLLAGLQKVHYVGYDQKETKIKFKSIPSVFTAFCQHVYSSSFWESDGGAWGALGYQLSCGCNCTTPIFTNFHVYSRLQRGPVYKMPPFGSSLLSLKWPVALFSVYPKIEFASAS